MRLRQEQELQVGDVKLWTTWTYGDFRDLSVALKGLNTDGTDEQATYSEFDQLIETHILQHISRVEGLEDAGGVPITTLTLEVLRQLPPSFLGGLIAAHQNLGEAAGPSR